jgi:hypothetical protein
MPPMLNSPPRLYLSASGQDRPFVDGLCARLRSRGLSVCEGGDLNGPATRDERQRDIDTIPLCRKAIFPSSQIRPGFHQGRRIAERIIADFNHYKRAL